MNLSEPIGDPRFAPFLVRISIGAYFAYVGYIKVQDVPFFIEQLKAYMPEHLASVLGILLPYLEIIIGGLLILGLWTTLAAILQSILLVLFVWAIGIFPKPEIPNKDLILLAASLSLLYSGAGMFSLDGLKKSS